MLIPNGRGSAGNLPVPTRRLSTPPPLPNLGRGPSRQVAAVTTGRAVQAIGPSGRAIPSFGRPPARGPAVARATAAGRRKQKQLTLEQALKRAGVHQVPWSRGTPWSIFTNGGGDVVAKAWAVELLKLIRAPVTPGNVAFVFNWQKAEGGGGQFNPLNQGPVPGHPQLTNTGQQYGGGAAGYNSWQAGLAGSAAYLSMPAFQGIRSALRANDPTQARAALIASPWASSHYGGGANFPNDPVPGMSIPGLPPVAPVAPGGFAGPQAGTGGGAAPAAPAVGGGVVGGGGVTHAPSPTGGGGTGGGTGGAGTGGAGGAVGAAGTGQTGPSPAAPGIEVTSAPGAGGGEGIGGLPTGPGTPLPGLGELIPVSLGLDLTKQALSAAGGLVPWAPLAAISNNFRAFLQGIDWLFRPSSWVRILCFAGGTASVGAGVILLAGSGGESSMGRAVKPAALPIGIASVGFGGILLFFAFHQLPTTVDSLPSLLSYIAADIRHTATSAPASTATTAITPGVQAM